VLLILLVEDAVEGRNHAALRLPESELLFDGAFESGMYLSSSRLSLWTSSMRDDDSNFWSLLALVDSATTAIHLLPFPQQNQTPYQLLPSW
jgi:hypothetical protein